MKKISFGLFAISACIVIGCQDPSKAKAHCAIQSGNHSDLSANEDAMGVTTEEQTGELHAN